MATGTAHTGGMVAIGDTPITMAMAGTTLIIGVATGAVTGAGDIPITGMAIITIITTMAMDTIMDMPITGVDETPPMPAADMHQEEDPV